MARIGPRERLQKIGILQQRNAAIMATRESPDVIGRLRPKTAFRARFVHVSPDDSQGFIANLITDAAPKTLPLTCCATTSIYLPLVKNILKTGSFLSVAMPDQ